MATNEFYYNGEKVITRDEAHELTDTSLLIVADKSFSLTARKEMVKKMKEDLK